MDSTNWVSNPEPDPYCPYCQRYAAEMVELDYELCFSQEEYDELQASTIDVRQNRRIEFVRKEEGTLNVINGHFACNKCYVKIGMPASRRGWVAP